MMANSSSPVIAFPVSQVGWLPANVESWRISALVDALLTD